MATQVKIFEGAIDPVTSMSTGIQDILDNEAPTQLSDLLILGFGDNASRGIIVIYDDGL